MCLSQCINHFCPDPKPSHHRPRGLVRSARSSPSNSLPFSSSRISHRYPHYLFVSLSHYFRTKTCACTCVRACVEEDRMSGRTATEMRVTGIGLHVSHPPVPLPSPPSPLILPPHPPRGTGSAGLRAFLMLNVAFCLCGCMGDSGERGGRPASAFFKC